MPRDNLATEPGQPNDDGYRKLTVNLPIETLEAILEVANKRHITRTEALRRAIVIQKYLEDAISEGAKILIERADRPTREIVFP